MSSMSYRFRLMTEYLEAKSLRLTCERATRKAKMMESRARKAWLAERKRSGFVNTAPLIFGLKKPQSLAK